jgi:small conductance mechanosensitive channel
VAKELAIVFGLAILADWLAWFVLRRPARRVEARAGASAAQQLLFLTASAVFEALPILAFALVAFFVLPLTKPNDATDHVATTLIGAYLWSRVIITVARVLLLSPSALALYPLDEETRNYLYIWVRRFINWTVYGLAVAACAWWLGAPGAIYGVLLRLVILVLGILAIVFVLQNRIAVASWLRGEPAEDAGRNPGWILLRQRLAEIWHILALVYILGVFGVFTLHIEGGVVYLLRSTVLSLVLVLAATLLVQFIKRGVRRGFAVKPEVAARFPTLEARTNRYVPVLVFLLSTAVYLLAVLALLQAWGINAFGWFQETARSRATGSMLSIVVSLAAALAAWELFVLMLERYLQRMEQDSRRRARARTLFPFLKLVMLVILVIILGFVMLDELGINIGPLLAGAGVFTIIAGLGSQAILKDIMTSIAVLVDDTFAVGDFIDVGNGHRGVVEAIALRTVRLRDTQGAILTVPFSEAKVIQNMTKDVSYYPAEISVSYYEEIDPVIDLMKAAAEELGRDPAFKPMVLGPLEVLGLDRFEQGAYIIQARLRTQPGKQWIAGREFNRRVKRAFDRHGISMRSDSQPRPIEPPSSKAAKPRKPKSN